MALAWRGQYIRYKEFFLNVFAVYKSRPDLKTFMEIILSAITISFFAIFALRPTLSTIAQLVKEIRQREELETKLIQKIKDLDTARTLYNSESRRIALVETAIPSKPPVETFVNQLEALSQSRGVTITNITIGETVLGGADPVKTDNELSILPEGANGMSFSISASGDYSSFVNIFSDLENFRMPAVLDSFGISARVSEEGRQLVLAISGRTPYLAKEDQNK